MALENIQYIAWPEEKAQLINPLHSDTIVKFSLAPAVSEISDLLERMKNIDTANFSMVVLTENRLLRSFPETVNAVSTQQEAYDIIEMERIERDLGF